MITIADQASMIIGNLQRDPSLTPRDIVRMLQEEGLLRSNCETARCCKTHKEIDG